MDLQTLRDVIVIVAAIIYSLVFLVTLIIVLVLSALSSTYLGKAHGFIHTKAWPLMDQIQARAEQVRLRTDALQRHPARPEAVAPEARESISELLLPMLALPSMIRRRRQPWWKRVMSL